MTDGDLVLGCVRLGPRGPLRDVQVRSGRIAAIVECGAGSRDAGAERLDLDGRVLLPGLWDAHTHLVQWAASRRRLDLHSAGSAAQAVALVRDALSAPRRTGEVLVGQGFRDALWPVPPEKGMLDAVSGAVPVLLASHDLHTAWASSAALALLGLDGHPTGLLHETAAFEAMQALGSGPEAVQDEWVAAALGAAAARGVVGLVDVEMANNLPSWIRRYRRAGARPVRIEAAFYPGHLDEVLAGGWRGGQELPGTGGLAVVGPLKVISDGALNTRSAWCVDAYPGSSGHGAQLVRLSELTDWMRRAHAVGIRSAVHAIGDAANAMVLDAFEQTGAAGSIEHAQLLSSGDAVRMARLGVVASVQPRHAIDDRDVADGRWADRLDRAFPLRSLLRAGVTVHFGSDAPVAALDPWDGIAAAVHRTVDEREPWRPEEQVTLAQALRAAARGRAKVTVGAVADLVVLDDDLAGIEGDDGVVTGSGAARLRAMPVSGTLLAGRWTHHML